MELALQLNSRDFYVAKKLLARFQLLFTGTYYYDSVMADSEYESISMTPLYLSYILTNSTSLELIGSAMFDRMDSQNYSSSYSGAIGLVHGYGKGNSFNIFLSAADKNYTDHFHYKEARLNYDYLDGQLYSVTCDWLPLNSNYNPISMGLLFFATTINYIDRQIIGLLKPILEKEFNWTETDFAHIVMAFTAAYAIGLLILGRFIDKIGTRSGYSIIIIIWSVAGMLHAIARSALHFSLARVGLGFG